MPKLSHSVRDGNKRHIEESAKALFIGQGFHATPMREIAARAGVSLGNLYNYYRTKEEILESVIARYSDAVNARLQQMFANLDEPLRADDLAEFGRQVKALVGEHTDFWLLMYIDVMEFQNRHFRKMFEGLAKRIGKRYAGYFEKLERDGRLLEGVDAVVGFTAAYMQFFNYFLVEKLFGGKRHFGIGDDEVITQLASIFSRGVLRPEARGQLKGLKKKSDARARPAQRKKVSLN
jgi:AcrR family transcriptional regulator